jgi:UDP-N-acetylglucosamine 2-epimerase (non-hydrolysing)
MAPVIMRLKKINKYIVRIAVTAQHRQMLDQVLTLFNIVPDFDLNLMEQDQDLVELTVRIILGLKKIFQQEKPDLILVQGDTNTTFAASLTAYYCQIPVGHIEAGLRTRDKYQPFPEEINRHLTGVIADYHFAPSKKAQYNLLEEQIPKDNIWVTGNTVIDALKWIENRIYAKKYNWHNYFLNNYGVKFDRRVLLVTSHRRENFGQGLENICQALKDLVEFYHDLYIVFPVHLNPNVQKPVYEILSSAGAVIHEHNSCCHIEILGRRCISLIPPLDYAALIFLMRESYLILTDSGGIQEEAPALGKPVLLTREVTERPEGIWSGAVKIVGSRRDRILSAVRELFDNYASYLAMSKVQNPYGDGLASKRIVNIIGQLL